MAVLKPFQLAIICDILSAYKYDQPFHHFFSGLAKQHRNWGSKDRKTYRNACYAYFRTGFMSLDQALPEMVQKALSLQEEAADDLSGIFPFKTAVSNQIDYQKWVGSHLKQKPVYLMVRKGNLKDCEAFLNQSTIPFESVNDYCLKLPADSKCDALTEQGLAWVMDLASAEACDKITLQAGDNVWDACSGAGGKALFIAQKYENQVRLTCSDKRFTILENLKARFLKLGMDLPKIELIDLMEASHLSYKYDSVILDVPCSGSGTWGRTPEQIRSFDENMPERYAKIQRKIAANALKNLKPGGQLFYLTCSVFAEENEETVKHLEINHHLTCTHSQYVHGDFAATDTLFFACLQKSDK